MDSIGNTEHALTFADLRIHCYTGQSCLISGEGRNKVFGYRHGVMTDIGDLTEDEWARLAKRLIEQAGEQELYAEIYERKQNMQSTRCGGAGLIVQKTKIRGDWIFSCVFFQNMPGLPIRIVRQWSAGERPLFPNSWREYRRIPSGHAAILLILRQKWLPAGKALRCADKKPWFVCARASRADP